MDILVGQAWRIAADLMLTAGLLKAGILIALLWLVVRLVPGRHADLRASLWTVGLGALFLMPLVKLGARGPLVNVQLVQFPQDMFRESVATSPAFWLALIWSAGTVALLARFAVHRLRIGWVAATAEPVERGSLRELLEEARARVGLRRRVRLAIADEAVAPILVGWLRPAVLLPPEAREWPRGRLLAVLCHELGHVRRGDYLWMVLGEVARAVYWVNPLVFLGLREARMEQDKACDAVALGAGFPSTVYARHLVDVARCVRSRSAAPAALSFGRRSDLGERVGVLLERRESAEVGSSGVGRVSALIVSVVLVASSAGVLAATDFWICTAAG